MPICLKVNDLAVLKEHLQGRFGHIRGFLNVPRVEHYFWMKSLKFRWNYRQSY